MLEPNTYPKIDCPIEGEIIGVTDKSGEATKGPFFYKVLATYPNGSKGVLTNVAMKTAFGGIGDYFQFRLRGSYEDADNQPTSKDFPKDSTRKAAIGDRVIIQFLGGHLNRPIITGFLPHPSTNWHYEKHSDLKPQGIFTYLGVTAHWDEAGQFQFVRRGAPEVLYKPSAGGLAGAIDSLASGSLDDSDDPTKPPNVPGLKPKPDDEVVRVAFLDGGVFRVTDSAGQMLEMDHNKNRIYISNNDLKSTDGSGESQGPQIATNSTDAEYILWDSDKQMILANARKLLELYSFDKRKDVTDGDYLSKVHGTLTWQVDKDVTEKFGGSHTYSAQKDYKANVGGDHKLTTVGDFIVSSTGAATLSSTKDMSLSSKGAFSATATQDMNFSASGGSSFKMANGKMALKGATGEVIDLNIQILQAILKLTVGTIGGASTPPINAADFASLLVKYQGLKM